MAAHYEEAHDATICSGPFKAKVLDDGSKIVRRERPYSYRNNDAGWFVYAGLVPAVFRTAVGGCYALDLKKIGASELRFGVRQLGRGPLRHRLASVKVSFGETDGTCFQYSLSRALAADERLEDDDLCAGSSPAVVRVDPAFLTPALVLDTGVPQLEEPWWLTITVSLVFRVAREA